MKTKLSIFAGLALAGALGLATGPANAWWGGNDYYGGPWGGGPWYGYPGYGYGGYPGYGYRGYPGYGWGGPGYGYRGYGYRGYPAAVAPVQPQTDTSVNK